MWKRRCGKDDDDEICVFVFSFHAMRTQMLEQNATHVILVAHTIFDYYFFLVFRSPVHLTRLFALPCVTFTSESWIYVLLSTCASFFFFVRFFLLLDKISNLDNILMASVSTRAIHEKLNVLVCSFVRC